MFPWVRKRGSLCPIQPRTDRPHETYEQPFEQVVIWNALHKRTNAALRSTGPKPLPALISVGAGMASSRVCTSGIGAVVAGRCPSLLVIGSPTGAAVRWTGREGRSASFGAGW